MVYYFRQAIKCVTKVSVGKTAPVRLVSHLLFDLFLSPFFSSFAHWYTQSWVIFLESLPYSFYIIHGDDKRHTQIRSHEYLHHIFTSHSFFCSEFRFVFHRIQSVVSFALIWYKLEKHTHTHTRCKTRMHIDELKLYSLSMWNNAEIKDGHHICGRYSHLCKSQFKKPFEWQFYIFMWPRRRENVCGHTETSELLL